MVGVRCLLSVAIDYGPLKTDFPLFGVNATNSTNPTNTNNVR